ncbi:Hypothetical_protein [Hexamita inflata]|uniref:Hypothetical_protein n=1 Tax=Hexamita inflata TaxID=28002 RepID=A0AA86Q6U2_9EUKA|nr:Hypothetical protein HINF_LOCUS34807 [Hexamita inflata]
MLHTSRQHRLKSTEHIKVVADPEKLEEIQHEITSILKQITNIQDQVLINQNEITQIENERKARIGTSLYDQQASIVNKSTRSPQLITAPSQFYHNISPKVCKQIEMQNLEKMKLFQIQRNLQEEMGDNNLQIKNIQQQIYAISRQSLQTQLQIDEHAEALGLRKRNSVYAMEIPTAPILASTTPLAMIQLKSAEYEAAELICRINQCLNQINATQQARLDLILSPSQMLIYVKEQLEQITGNSFKELQQKNLLTVLIRALEMEQREIIEENIDIIAWAENRE